MTHDVVGTWERRVGCRYVDSDLTNEKESSEKKRKEKKKRFWEGNSGKNDREACSPWDRNKPVIFEK